MGDGIFCAAATTWLPGLGVSKKVANLRLIAADKGGPIHLSFACGLERQNLYAALPCLNRELIIICCQNDTRWPAGRFQRSDLV